MKERNVISDEAFSQLAASFFSMPVEVYKGDATTPQAATAKFSDQSIPNGTGIGDVVVFTNPDTPALQGLYVWDGSKYIYTIPKAAISAFLVSGGYCLVYTGNRTKSATPSDPTAEYTVFEGGVNKQVNTIPADSNIYGALYNGVPFVLTPASTTKLGGVKVPTLPLKAEPDGSLGINAATNAAPGVVTFTNSKSDVSITAPNMLAVDNKTLASLNYAPIDSPVLTGTPKSVQPDTNAPAEMIATVKYVKDQLSAGDVSFRTHNQIWEAQTGKTTVSVDISTIKTTDMVEGSRLDFSFILNDSNTANDGTANNYKQNPNKFSTKSRGVSVLLAGNVLIGSASQNNTSLSGVNIDAIGTPTSSDLDDNAKTYLDKKVEGSIWFNHDENVYFMVSVTELGVKNASTQISYPVKLKSNPFTQDATLEIQFYFESTTDKTYLVDTVAEIIKD